MTSVLSSANSRALPTIASARRYCSSMTPVHCGSGGWPRFAGWSGSRNRQNMCWTRSGVSNRHVKQPLVEPLEARGASSPRAPARRGRTGRETPLPRSARCSGRRAPRPCRSCDRGPGRRPGRRRTPAVSLIGNRGDSGSKFTGEAYSSSSGSRLARWNRTIPRTVWNIPSLNFTRSQSLQRPRPTSSSFGAPAERIKTRRRSGSGWMVSSRRNSERSFGLRGPIELRGDRAVGRALHRHERSHSRPV